MKCRYCNGTFPDYETECPTCKKPLDSSFSFETAFEPSTSAFPAENAFKLIEQGESSASKESRKESGESLENLIDGPPSTPATESEAEGAKSAVRQMKANRKYMNMNCPQCMQLIFFGDDITICNECDSAYHPACYPPGGCTSAACAGKRTAPPAARKTNILGDPPYPGIHPPPARRPAAGMAEPLPPISAPALIPSHEQPQQAVARGIIDQGGDFKNYLGKFCPVCKNAAFAGDEVYVCKTCENVYHKWCFPTTGCDSERCKIQTRAVPSGAMLAPDEKFCFMCRGPIKQTAVKCRHCGAILDPKLRAERTDGSGGLVNDKTAGWNSVILGAASIMTFMCVCLPVGPLCAYYAIKRATIAKQDEPQAMMGSIGYVLGVIGYCLYGFFALMALISMATKGH
jgi:hypothetical protein